MDNKEFISKENFLNSIFRDFLHKSTKGEKSQEQIENVYKVYKKLLDNQLAVSKDKAKEIGELNELLDKIHELFLDEKARKVLVDSGMKSNEIIDKYGKKILGIEPEAEEREM